MGYHSDHCRACKERVFELLRAIYGIAEPTNNSPWPAQPEAYANTAVGRRFAEYTHRLRGLARPS